MSEPSESLEALREAFMLEAEGCRLACWDPPVEVAGLGWVATISLFDGDDYRGPRAELVIGDGETTVEQALELALEAVGRIVTIGLRKSLKLELDVVLDLPRLDLDDPELPVRLCGEDAPLRRATALRICTARFEAVAAKLREVYGLIAPRHLIGWAALLRSLNHFERRGLAFLGRSSGGIMLWFEDGGLDRQPRDGLDPRLECRFRRDPPELVTIAWGDSDGLHYGLWYDDPEQPPTTIVGNYARDSAETWDQRVPSMITLLERQLADLAGEEAARADVLALADALAWFRGRDEELRAGEAVSIWANVERPVILGSMGPALRAEHGDPRAGHAQVERRVAAYRSSSEEVGEWIAAARVELADGKPAFALVLGQELHWFDADEWRETGLELLVDAYEALGRHALAEIARVHHRHRDLASVGVY
jgi:hypothetical protein